MDERLKFIARLLDGEKMAGLCREFGISRKTVFALAGAGGFEPPHGGIKIHCLTTWRRPNGRKMEEGRRPPRLRFGNAGL